jgi:hypothetical protein
MAISSDAAFPKFYRAVRNLRGSLAPCDESYTGLVYALELAALGHGISKAKAAQKRRHQQQRNVTVDTANEGRLDSPSLAAGELALS